MLQPDDLHHCASELNAADPASRGLTPEKLMDCKLWLEGPEFLKEDILPTGLPEAAEGGLDEGMAPNLIASNAQNCLATTVRAEEKDDMFKRISIWQRLFMVTAWILLWKANKGAKTKLLYPSCDIIERAKSRVIRYYQRLELGEDLKGLTRFKWLTQLTPGTDSEGVLRVGGRTQKSELQYDRVHPPIILGRLREILVRFTHLDNLHAANSVVQRLLQEEYYFSGIKNLIFLTLRRCVRCARFKNKRYQPIMSELPSFRVKPSYLYSHVGLDFFGPINLKAGFFRTPKLMKIWVCVIIDLASKACHLEIATGLSLDCFISVIEIHKKNEGH